MAMTRGEKRQLRKDFVAAVFGLVNATSEDDVRCVQVGACDGRRWDPVYEQVTTRGWRALVIEPHPHYFARLTENYRKYPKVTPLKCAISHKQSSLFLYHLSLDAIERYPMWVQGCSSLHPQRLNDSVQTACRLRDIEFEVGDITGTLVDCLPLDTVLSENAFEHLDVLVIDVEGHELSVLESLSTPSLFPKVAIVECNGRSLVEQSSYVEALSRKGMRSWRVGDDIWGISSSLVESESSDIFRLLPELTLETTKNETYAAPTSSEISGVPRRLGHIWVGDLCPPSEWMKTWKEMHPEWEYTLFDNSYLMSRRWRNDDLIREYMKRREYAGVADLMRYEILFEGGGFIPEADSICLLRCDELFRLPSLYTVYENEVRKPGLVSPFLASVPQHPFLKTVIEVISDKEAAKLRTPYWDTGNKFLSLQIASHDPEISIFPSHFFIPQHKKFEPYQGDGPIFAEQKWGTTFGRYDTLPQGISREVTQEIYDWLQE